MAQCHITAASALQSRIKDNVPKINEIIKSCKVKVAGLLQPAVDQIVALCLGIDLAYRKNILGRHCGIHPENRSKTGVDPFNAQNLTLKISLQGYSESKLENPMGFEKAEPGPAASAQSEFMLRNFDMSNAYLRSIPFYDVEYLPVTCSHTFAALNIIEGEDVRGLHEELSTNGKIDQVKALQLCPSWKKPMADGIPCIVFRRELEAACPELAGFLSMAGNQSHEVHSKETKVQLMLSFHQLFVAQMRLHDTAASAPSAESDTAASASWDQVVKEMTVMKPHFARCAKESAEFAAAWSGGDHAPGLNDAEAYAKSLKVRKEPEDGQLGILAKAQLKRAPRWPIACLKTLLQAPEQFCRRMGEASMFTNADIKLMETKLNPQIMEACKLMEQARAWFGSDMRSMPALTLRILGDMDVRLVMHVHGFAKKVKTRKQHPDLEAIAHEFAKDVQDHGGDLKDCPWKLPTAASAPETAASAQPLAQPSTILTFGADGSLSIGQLKKIFGMELGTTVALKKDPKCINVLHIVKVEGHTITLLGADSINITVTAGELVDLYKIVKVEPDILVRNADLLKIEAHTAAMADAIGSHARQVLFHAFRLHQPHACVDMKFIKGKDRHVFAAAKYPTGGLKLVSYSSNLINVAVEGKEQFSSAFSSYIQLKIRVKEIGSVFAATFSAASGPKAHPTTAFAKELIVPFWLVRSTGDKDRANMIRSAFVCKMSMAAGKEETTCDPVSVPILQNTRPLKEGEELLTYDDILVKAHSMEPIVPEVPAAAQSPKKRAAVSAPKRRNQPKKKAMKTR